MKEVEWSEIYGEGEIVCYCDNDSCNEEERVDFEDGPDFKEAQDIIEEIGWVSSKINGEWKDFCSQTCRRKYLEKNL